MLASLSMAVALLLAFPPVFARADVVAPGPEDLLSGSPAIPWLAIAIVVVLLIGATVVLVRVFKNRKK